MLIITSNEDLIREFSSKKLKNTQIIDLDIHKQISIEDQTQQKSFLTPLPSQVCLRKKNTPRNCIFIFRILMMNNTTLNRIKSFENPLIYSVLFAVLMQSDLITMPFLVGHVKLFSFEMLREI